MDQVRQVMRYHHYAYRTEKTYSGWIIRYVKFHGSKKHPRDMGKREIEAFLSHLAVDRDVSASTQRQAYNAIIFLYDQVINIPVSETIEAVKAKRHPHIPVVMTQNEVKLVFNQMQGNHLIMARLLYGGGLRLMECLRLRVGNLDFDRNKIYVRGAKGGKDRLTLLPRSIQEELKIQLDKVKRLHNDDLVSGFGETHLPFALARKYPNASKEFVWQYIFPAKKLSKDPRTGIIRRHHVLESGLQKAVKVAVTRAGIIKRIGCHTFRHSFATHLLENGVNIRVVQELMGHANVKTTEIYTHVMERDLNKLRSPLDVLEDEENIT
ncbi:MAG: integron integrase [Candidatus Marinimicrobia bacterium]|nr:integron integrase [Candidatus Neomarinimicrobiota bacterium]